MLPMMDGGDDVGMVLSPQCFHNLNQEGDIFNHSNIHFWECAPFRLSAVLKSAVRIRSLIIAGSHLITHSGRHLEYASQVAHLTCRYMQPGYDALGFISCTGASALLPVLHNTANHHLPHYRGCLTCQVFFCIGHMRL